VEEVLKSKFQSPHFKDTNTATEHSLQIAKDFLLGELAFIVNAANILGRSRSAYVYHQEMPVLRKLIAGQYAGFTPPGNTGCIVVSEKREETEK
jgi:tRNA-dependent cyclodipeptide synthase